MEWNNKIKIYSISSKFWTQNSVILAYKKENIALTLGNTMSAQLWLDCYCSTKPTLMSADQKNVEIPVNYKWDLRFGRQTFFKD